MSIVVKCANGENLELRNVLYTPKLCVNILSLGQLDEAGCSMKLENGILVIHDSSEKLLTKVCRSHARLY